MYLRTRTRFLVPVLGAVLLLACVAVVQSLRFDQRNIANGQESLRQPDVRSIPLEHKDPVPSADECPSVPIARLKDHGGVVWRIAFSPDQKTVVTGGGDVGWWSARTGEKHRLIEVWDGGMYVGTAHALTISRKGRLLATGHVRSMVFLWDLPTGKQLRSFSLSPDRSSMGVIGLAFLSDDSILATAVDNRIHFLDLRSSKEVRRINTGECITALAWDPNSNWLATGHHPRMFEVLDAAGDVRVDSEGMVQLWNAATGKRVRTLRWGKGSIFALSFSPDGRILAAGDSHPTGRVVFWDTSTGRELASVIAHPEDKSKRPALSTEILPPRGGVRCIAFSPDGRLLVSGGGDGMVRVCEVASAKEICHLDGRKHIPLVVVGDRTVVWASECVYSVAFAPDGNTIASAHERGSALLWDLRRKIAGEKPLPATLTVAQLEACWADLASPQPLHAYRAIEQLRVASRVSVPFVQGRLQPLPPPDARLVARWIADLDSDNFSAREKATQSLQAIADQVERPLLKALAANPSKEARRRLHDILSMLETTRTSPARLRILRTLRLLERIGTPEARQVVESLAKNDSRGWLSRDAEATFRRMKPSAASTPR